MALAALHDALQREACFEIFTGLRGAGHPDPHRHQRRPLSDQGGDQRPGVAEQFQVQAARVAEAADAFIDLPLLFDDQGRPKPTFEAPADPLKRP